MRSNFLVLFILLTFLSSIKVRAQEPVPLRQKAVRDYLDEFASPSFKTDLPKIGQALQNVLMKIPAPVFESVTSRAFPIIFIGSISSGIARFANATEFTFRENEAPAFQEGFYLVLLSDELNQTADAQAIEGIIAHEIAHRYLGHLKAEAFSCELEREANQQIKTWGFEKEFNKAKGAFGSKSHTDSPCYNPDL